MAAVFLIICCLQWLFTAHWALTSLLLHSITYHTGEMAAITSINICLLRIQDLKCNGAEVLIRRLLHEVELECTVIIDAILLQGSSQFKHSQCLSSKRRVYIYIKLSCSCTYIYTVIHNSTTKSWTSLYACTWCDTVMIYEPQSHSFKYIMWSF